jgi:hypothetical protein
VSDKWKPDGRAREPEILRDDRAPKPESILRIERPAPSSSLGSIIANIVHSPKRDERKAREVAGAVNAESDLNDSLTKLALSRARLHGVNKLIGKDEEQRDLDLIRLKNQRAEEERIAKHKALQDELDEEEIRAKIAEARRRRQQAEKPPLPVDENTRRRAAIAAKFREKLGTRYTEQEIRAHAAREIGEIRQRAGDRPLSESDEREIRNITDAMNDLLNEL